MEATKFVQILSELQGSASNTTHFDESWSQGRSAFGGLSAAFAITAMNKRVDAQTPLRSLMVSFIAPIPPGEVQVETHIQRQGKNVTQLSASVFSQGQLCLQAMGVYGRGRPATASPPTDQFNPLPREQGIAFEDHARRLPSFLSYFEGCWAGGGLPFSGRKETTLDLWARHLDDLAQFPAEQICAIADIPPPVMLSHFTTPTPASSLTWSLEFIVPPPDVNAEWFYLHFDLDSAADGYTQQSGRIYAEDGRLCALTRQCMVYFEQN